MKRRRKPRGIIGYVPVRHFTQAKDRTRYLNLTTNKRNQLYSGTIHAKLQDWLKEGTIRYVGNVNHLSDYMNSRVRCVLPLVVEERKPRLCIDGSAMSSVGPDEKPLCILDNVNKCLSQIQPNMWMTKTDDRLDQSFLLKLLIF